ncbi:MAG: hypothetical protein FD123_3254 [Bacteroidetes bacterium]|nr:MAG: hypothetical protein FD123_3254 [Bacteroidota bacterium]
MRKNYLALILFSGLFSLSLDAQTYYPLLDSTVNRWSYATQMLGVNSPDPDRTVNCGLPINAFPFSDPKEYTTTDTIIDSLTYKILLHEEYLSPCLLGFIREDTAARRVYFRSFQDTAEYLLYDFSLQPGNTIYLDFPLSSAYQPGTYLLDSIVNVSVTAGVRRKFFFSCSSFPFQYPFTWIESAGAQTALVYTETYLSVIGTIFSSCPGGHHEMSEFLACFSHLNMVYFDTCALNAVMQNISNGGYVTDSCSYYYFTGSVNDREKTVTLSLQPNPASDEVLLELELQVSSEITICIFDAAGRRVGEPVSLGKIPAGKTRKKIETGSFTPGIYFISCRSENATTYSKLVIQH